VGVISIFGRLLKPEDFRRANASDRARPGEQRWIAIEDMDPIDAAIASDQQRSRTTPQQAAPGDVWGAVAARRSSSSFPWPTDSSGQMLAGRRGLTSGVPGAEPVNDTGGSER
jgi:hypothetical protein